MNIETLKNAVDTLKADGVVFTVNGSNLAIEGESSLIDQEVISFLKQHKQQIIRLLSEDSKSFAGKMLSSPSLNDLKQVPNAVKPIPKTSRKKVIRQNGKPAASLEPGLDEHVIERNDMSDSPKQPQEQNPQPASISELAKIGFESQGKAFEKGHTGIEKSEFINNLQRDLESVVNTTAVSPQEMSGSEQRTAHSPAKPDTVPTTVSIKETYKPIRGSNVSVSLRDVPSLRDNEVKRHETLNHLSNGSQIQNRVIIQCTEQYKSTVLPGKCACGSDIYGLNQENTIGQCFRCNSRYEVIVYGN